MKKITLTLLIAATALMASDGASLYKKCAGCHGAKAEKKALGKSNIIAGLDVATLVKDISA